MRRPFPLLATLALLLPALALEAQEAAPDTALRLRLLPGERWWGGHTEAGPQMPFVPGYAASLYDNRGNQVQPLLLSSAGRSVWSEGAYRFGVGADALVVTDAEVAVTVDSAGATLAEAYRRAAAAHFAFSGPLPDERLFRAPQYNTWIELIYDQNQADVLRYARGIVDAGFPPGVLMIDDNWQRDYGDWRFRPDRFPDPRGMVDTLHALGFQVMLWVSPLVSADHENFRALDERLDGLLRDPANPSEAKVVRWWNGFSAELDLTSPGGEAWFREQLEHLVDAYGVDGFKLDAGDFELYAGSLSAKPDATPRDHSEAFARIGLAYPLNEYRAAWRMGGEPLAMRLRDKDFTWEALRMLVPGMTTMGLLGYPFACPDMVGGGEYRSFLALDSLDGELIVRSAQVHALMPMMQFSVAPWRVLDGDELAAVRAAARLHAAMGDTLVAYARAAARTGEPIVRPLAYDFPEGGFEEVRDQFLLGGRYLVAPVVVRGARRRMVRFPRGVWRRVGGPEDGRVYEGPVEAEVSAGLEELPYFELVEK